MRLRPIALLALVAAVSACTGWHTERGPRIVPLNVAGTVRVTRHDGGIVMIDHARVVGDSIVGDYGSPGMHVAVATADVSRVDTRRVSAARTGGLTLGVVIVVALVAVAAATAAVLGGWN